MRIPSFSIRSLNSPVNLTEVLGPNNSTDSVNPRLIQNITLEVSDVDMDGDLHENYFRTDISDEDNDDEEDEQNDEINISGESPNNSAASDTADEAEDDEDDDDDEDEADDDESRESRRKGFRRKYRKVNLDRPFIVYVEDSTVGTVFMGRVNVVNPVENEVPSTSENSASPEDEDATTTTFTSTISSSTESLPSSVAPAAP